MSQVILSHPVALVVLAAAFYLLGAFAVRRSLRHLAPNVSRGDVAWNPASFRDEAGIRRLTSLYTPRGWRLRSTGMRLLTVSAGLVVLAIIAGFSHWL